MSEHWTDRLSAYLDGELSPVEAARLEAHLAGCDACAATLEELRRVVAAARELPAAAPERDLWPDIQARLGPRTAEGVSAVPIASRTAIRARSGASRRVALTVPQLIAAGIALVVLSAGGAWLALAPQTTTGQATASAPEGAPTAGGRGGSEAGVVAYATSWESAVSDLETEFERRREVLDPATIQVVETNLALIDQAIAEARGALEADPSSGFLNGYLADAMRRKVDLLRQATRIQRTES